MTRSLLGSELGKKWDGASRMERTAGPEVSGQGGAGADGEQESQCSWSRERGENSTCGLEGARPAHVGRALKDKI